MMMMFAMMVMVRVGMGVRVMMGMRVEMIPLLLKGHNINLFFIIVLGGWKRRIHERKAGELKVSEEILCAFHEAECGVSSGPLGRGGVVIGAGYGELFIKAG
uniref:Secreted protein n=1 Tax=Lepeophtheirus salmonis TaxID=72036 RepID=A0A0K2TE25_LEPSM